MWAQGLQRGWCRAASAWPWEDRRALQAAAHPQPSCWLFARPVSRAAQRLVAVRGADPTGGVRCAQPCAGAASIGDLEPAGRRGADQSTGVSVCAQPLAGRQSCIPCCTSRLPNDRLLGSTSSSGHCLVPPPPFTSACLRSVAQGLLLGQGFGSHCAWSGTQSQPWVWPGGQAGWGGGGRFEEGLSPAYPGRYLPSASLCLARRAK